MLGSKTKEELLLYKELSKVAMESNSKHADLCKFMYEILKSIEFIPLNLDDDLNCPYCFGSNKEQHQEDCKIDLAIKEYKKICRIS